LRSEISSSSDIGSLIRSSIGLVSVDVADFVTRWACFENRVLRSADLPLSSPLAKSLGFLGLGLEPFFCVEGRRGSGFDALAADLLVRGFTFTGLGDAVGARDCDLDGVVGDVMK
jgi:hypothetical protein